MRIALYVRTSTERDQNPAMQIDELKDYCIARGWVNYTVFNDHGFTAKNMNRPALKDMLKKCENKEFDSVLVWKLDRFSRSLKEFITVLSDLDKWGVSFISLKDALDLSTPHGKLMMHMLGAFAQFESDIISMRTKSGVQHAIRNGKKVGRPKARNDDVIHKLIKAGLSTQEIHDTLKIHKSSIQRSLIALKKQNPKTQ